MSKVNQHKHLSAAVGAASPRAAVAADNAFPPLTTSLKAFVKNGSDHAFRELIFELNSLINQMRRHLEHFARYIGVSPAQCTFILIVSEMPDVTVGQIAERMNVTSPFVTAEIGKLIKMGIVDKKPNANDRRSSFLRLTPRGKNLVRELAPILCTANDLHFRSLTEQSAKALKDMIHALVAHGRQVTHELESPDMRNAVAASVTSAFSILRKPDGKRRSLRGTPRQ